VSSLIEKAEYIIAKILDYMLTTFPIF